MQISEKDEIIQTMNKLIDNVINNLNNTMNARFTKLENKIDKIQLEEIPALKKDLGETKKEVRKISKTVAVIEHEHGDKLKMLFDAVTMNSQKIMEQNQEIKKLYKLYQNHDDRIYLLESKVLGQR